MEDNFVGIILAGGTGTRLRPMTKVTNKHAMGVYDRPMIYYPLQLLVNAGVKKILIVTGSESGGDFMELLKDGSDFGVRIAFLLQREADGIAGALKLCKDFVGDSNIIVALGDNLFSNFDLLKNVSSYWDAFEGAHVFLKKVSDPQRFGVAVIDNGVISSFVEKPKEHISDYAVTGLYVYDRTVWEKIDKLTKSDRGEYEITDIQNMYLSELTLDHTFLSCFWSDMGTPDSLLDSAIHMREMSHLTSNKP